MYSTTHTASGVITAAVVTSLTDNINLALGLSFGIGFASHLALDLINERGDIRTFNSDLITTLGLVLLSFISCFFDYEFIVILMGIAGALSPDLIDKKFGLSYIDSDEFPMTFYFHKWKPVIQLSKWQTDICQIVSFFVALAILIYKTI